MAIDDAPTLEELAKEVIDLRADVELLAGRCGVYDSIIGVLVKILGAHSHTRIQDPKVSFHGVVTAYDLALRWEGAIKAHQAILGHSERQ